MTDRPQQPSKSLVGESSSKVHHPHNGHGIKTSGGCGRIAGEKASVRGRKGALRPWRGISDRDSRWCHGCDPNQDPQGLGQRLELPRMIVAYDVARQALDTLTKTTEEPEEISLDDGTLDPIAVDEEDDDAQEDQSIDMMEGQSDATDSDICLTADD